MELRKWGRSCRTPSGWRLATVEEANNRLVYIRQSNLLEEWDRARLLNGWIGGSAYDFKVEEAFRSCLGYMLLIESPTREISDAVLYSEVAELSIEGRNAALLLCCEDWNKEVLNWLMPNETSETRAAREDTMSLREGDGTKVASEVVSAIARELQGFHANVILGETDSSLASSGAFRQSLAATQECLRAFETKIQESDEDNITHGVVEDTLREIRLADVNATGVLDIVEPIVRVFGFDTSVTSTSWEFLYTIAEVESRHLYTMHSVCYSLYKKMVMHSEAEDDSPTPLSLLYYAYHFIRKDYGSFGTVAQEAPKKANGGCKSDALSSFLVRAAKKGDENMVQWLIENGVAPSKTYYKGKTALHYATELEDEFIGLRIAEMLLAATEERLADEYDSAQNRTSLHTAVLGRHAKICKLLIRKKARVTFVDVDGRTPLHHEFLSNEFNEEVVRLLISAEREDRNEACDPLVDVKDKGGKTPLDFAIKCHASVNMVAWLLSLSKQPDSYFIKLQDLSLYLRESSRMQLSLELVQKLMDGGANPFETDDDGRTALHYTAEGADEDVAWEIIKKLLFDKNQGSPNMEKASASDRYGRNVLHVAAFLGREGLCAQLLQHNRNMIDTKDRDGQTPIYYAVAATHDEPRVLDLLLREQSKNHVSMKDFNQTTLLHVAAGRGNTKMVEKLLSLEISEKDQRLDHYVEAPDLLGQTALHKAASGGHWKIVELLLDNGAHPLKERDCDGKSALHFAREANGENAVEIAKLLLKSCHCDKQRSLLLFASAVENGRPNPSLDEHLEWERKQIREKSGQENLLQLAARLGDIDMTREFITRGQNIALIRNEQWRKTLPQEEQDHVRNVLGQIKSTVEQGTDKPALRDNLRRNPFAIGLAALFLNPFVKSPVTVGISGEWGMGKSSVMVQTESILLKTAAQLAWPNSSKKEDISGAGEDRRKIVTFPRFCKSADLDLQFNDGVLEKEYGPKIYHQILKSRAVIGRHDMFEKDEESGSGSQTTGEMTSEEYSLQGAPPSILTVQYNAWHYRNETEAWAGLAVKITEEIEATMTVAHKLRTSWIYNWRNRRDSVCFKVIFPFFLALVVAIFLSIIAWLLLGTSHNKNLNKLKYGGLPASMIVAAWGTVKSVMSFVKPISSQVVDYICLPDHSQKLGYHQKVIDDIKFLKEQLYYKRSRKWEVFACIWCWITWNWDANYVPGTRIPKIPPAFNDNLRIIVFVDDLDRCEENVILQVLSGVNLVLATCHINVILSMDNSMIQRAIMRKYGNNDSKSHSTKSNELLADNYLRKIIQLPLQLPDPSDKESREFLQSQLGMSDGSKGSTTEKRQTYRRRKANPKYQIGNSFAEESEPGRVENKEDMAGTGDQQRPPGSSDTTQQGLASQEDHDRDTIDYLSEGSQAEEANTEIHETISDEQQKIIEKPEGSQLAEEAKIEIPEILGIEQPNQFEKPGDQEQREDKKGKLSLTENLSSIFSAMLIPKYTQGEINVFHFVNAQCTGKRKLPREWKCLLAYHRLAWNILSLTHDIDPVEGWHVQLIAWIFVCWEWRDLITILIQNWNNLGVLRKWKAVEEFTSGPSLREIVEHYIEERWPAGQKRATEEEDPTTDRRLSSPEEVEKISGILSEENATTQGDEYLKDVLREVLKEREEMREALTKNLKEQEEMREALERILKEQEEMRKMLQMITNNSFEEEEENSVQPHTRAEKREEWNRLNETLCSYNVSMDGIQAFQKFRFYCQPGYLPWPLTKQA